MPFTAKQDREKVARILALSRTLDEMRKDLKPGDRCFNHYRGMKKAWKKARRWTTADELAKVLFPDDEMRAYFLGFLVFFAKEVMKYEDEKMAENGDVDED